MKANTAAAMVVGSGALLLSTSSPRVALRVTQLCGVFLALLGAVTLGDYASSRDFGIDQLLIAEPQTKASCNGWQVPFPAESCFGACCR